MLMASGLAATQTITHLLSAGDHIVAMNDLYGGKSFLVITCFQGWECSSFQEISSFCAKSYQIKVFWILTEGYKSNEILEWVGGVPFFRFAVLILAF